MPVPLTEEMSRLLLRANVAVIGTVGPRGTPNLSLKGVVEVDPRGHIYFLDLYHGKTRRNLRRDAKVSLAVFDVREFAGFQFVGRARLMRPGPLFDRMAARWKDKRRNLISGRIVENIRTGFSHGRSEHRLPDPKYLVRVTVERVYNLVPASLRR